MPVAGLFTARFEAVTMVSNGGCCLSLQKWSKGKQKEKVNNAVLFDQATYDKMLTEVPKFKQITPSILSERLRVCYLHLCQICPTCLVLMGRSALRACGITLVVFCVCVFHIYILMMM
jgi:hypothetical protein